MDKKTKKLRLKAKKKGMKFCVRHRQQYMKFLPKCPICRGEHIVLVRGGEGGHVERTAIRRKK